ncbi:SPOR domain-containing protein [Zhongshania aliphaticivorans]|uniref:SPOR domain-containing protein n=1 Tax=Zhongshania aliphaticivorans TaxID=1470434 RepID=UPI0012E56C73|nr:SPOR domain-containing protein [Zhongshania aliphaticivorans]CAA0116745.1 Uncharacterised protein [Zhongshania aliphaticivorans]
MRWFFVLLVAVNTAFFLSDKGSISLESVTFTPEDKGNIQLLSELGLGGTKSLTKEEASNRDVAAGAEKRACLFLGPYSNKDEVLAGRISSGDVKLFAEKYERSADYWVYLGPYSSFNEAAKVGAELRGKRIDNFIIRGGELKNAISLGVFTTEERARVHAKGLLKREYSSAVKRVAKEGVRYWMAYVGLEGDQSLKDIARVMEKKTDNNKSLEKKSCNLIASYQELD